MESQITCLYAQSVHPRHVIKGILMGQYAHIRRNCSDHTAFEEEAGKLQRFLARGYGKECLKLAYKQTKGSPRDFFLFQGEVIPDHHHL